MADGKGFGDRLRSARQQSGMSLDEAGRRLRIEPKVLDAIEQADFANMPPKYMTRSMVNAYASLLGLNPTATTREFLDAEYQYQLGRTSGGYYDNSQANNQISTRIASPSTISQASDAYKPTNPPTRPSYERGSLPRTTDSVSFRQASAPAGKVESAWGPGGIPRVGAQLASDTGRQRVSATDDDNSTRRAPRRNADGSIRRPRFTALEDEEMDFEEMDTPPMTQPQGPKKDYSRMLMMVGCALAIVAIVLLVKVIFVTDENTDPNAGTNAPISGMTDPEQVGIGTSTENVPSRTPIKPTACYVSIQLGEENTYMTICSSDSDFWDSNDNAYYWATGRDSILMDTWVDGGSRFQYDVTNKMLIRTSASVAGNVTVTVNGERMDFIRQDYHALWVIDFDAYLKDWEEKNKTEE